MIIEFIKNKTGIKVQLTVKEEIMLALPPNLSFWSPMSGHHGLKIYNKLKKKHDSIFNIYTLMLSLWICTMSIQMLLWKDITFHIPKYATLFIKAIETVERVIIPCLYFYYQ